MSVGSSAEATYFRYPVLKSSKKSETAATVTILLYRFSGNVFHVVRIFLADQILEDSAVIS